MRKTEFMDLLKYYFHKSSKDDLKGILEDCEEQFRIGADEGKSEEEICCKLGHPKNIYRYYIGKPIVPEDNPKMPYAYDDRSDTEYTDDRTRPYNTPPHEKQNRAYDWENDPQRLRRRAQSEQYYRQPYPSPNQHISGDESNGEAFQWGKDNALSPAAMIVNPFMQIIGTLFHILGGFLFIFFAVSVIGSIAITSMPLYLYSDLLPLPTITSKTLIFANLAILFAAMSVMYAGSACQNTGKSNQRKKGRG
jgi:uncharacterized membrane protein